MACSYFAALGFGIEPGDPAAEPVVQLLLPAAEAVAELWARADEIEARLNAFAAVQAARLLRDAEERGELDDALFPDVVLADEYVQGLEWDRLLVGPEEGGARR